MLLQNFDSASGVYQEIKLNIMPTQSSLCQKLESRIV